MSYSEFTGAAMKWGKSRTEALFRFFRVNEDNDDVISMDETKAAFNMTDFNSMLSFISICITFIEVTR